MDNMKKNFKKKNSALRCMADGGMLDRARTAVGDMISNQTGRGQYDPNPGMKPPMHTQESLPTGVRPTADTILNTRARQMQALGLRDGGRRYEDGGKVTGPGGPVDDKVGPVMLSDEEYVLPADTVKAIGKENLDALRVATHDFVDEDKEHSAKRGLRGLANGGQLDMFPQGLSTDRMKQLASGVRSAEAARRPPIPADPVMDAQLARGKASQAADIAADRAARAAANPRPSAPRIQGLRPQTTPVPAEGGYGAWRDAANARLKGTLGLGPMPKAPAKPGPAPIPLGPAAPAAASVADDAAKAAAGAADDAAKAGGNLLRRGFDAATRLAGKAAGATSAGAKASAGALRAGLGKTVEYGGRAARLGGSLVTPVIETYETVRDVTTDGMTDADKAARIGEGGARVAGAGLGAAAGSVLGPLGTLAGGAAGYLAPDAVRNIYNAVTGNELELASDKAKRLRETGKGEGFFTPVDPSKIAAPRPGDLDPYQIEMLKRAGVKDPLQKPMSEDWKAGVADNAINNLGTKDYQRLPGSGTPGETPIFGRVNEDTKKANSGMLVTDKRMNDFVGVGKPRTEEERLADGKLANDRVDNALRIYSSMSADAGPRIDSNAQAINERFDKMARDAEVNFGSSKAAGNRSKALIEIERARAAALGQDQSNMVSQRGQDTAAAERATLRASKESTTERDAMKAQLDALTAQLKLRDDAREQDKFLQDKQAQSQERLLKQAQGMFTIKGEDGKQTVDEVATNQFMTFLQSGGVKDPETGKSFLELRPEEQEQKMPLFKKAFEMAAANNAEAEAAGGATTGGLFAAPVQERDATLADWWNDRLSAGSYLRAKGQDWNPLSNFDGKVVDNGTNLGLSSDVLLDENGNIDSSKVKLLRQYTGR